MPLTAKGEKILKSMERTYGSEAKAKEVLFASKNAGKISGIDSASRIDSYLDAVRRGDAAAMGSCFNKD